MQREKIVRLKPLGDCVLIKEDPFKPYHKYIGLKHVVVPDMFQHGPKDRNPWGRVLALGPNCDGDVKKGDRVTWGKWSGARFDFGEKVLVLVRCYDILAKDAKH